MIRTNYNKISYFSFNFDRKSTYCLYLEQNFSKIYLQRALLSSPILPRAQGSYGVRKEELGIFPANLKLSEKSGSFVQICGLFSVILTKIKIAKFDIKIFNKKCMLKQTLVFK